MPAVLSQPAANQNNMKTRLLALVILLAPLATNASDAPPVPSPAPLVEPTQRAIVAMQRLYEQNLMLSYLFGCRFHCIKSCSLS